MNNITLTPGKTASFSFEGYFFDKTFYVFISSNKTFVTPSISAINLFPGNTALALNFPAFSGYPITTYLVNNNNFINVNVSNLPALSASYDVIIGNNAGYTTLSKLGYIIDYTNVPVLSTVPMLTEAGNIILTESNNYITLEKLFYVDF